MITFRLLPAQFHAELELPRIKSRCRLACFRVQGVHVSHVEPVDEVEYVHGAFQLHALIEADGFGQPHIGKDGHGPRAALRPRLPSSDPLKNAVKGAVHKTGNLESARWRSVGRDCRAQAFRGCSRSHRVRTIGGSAEIEILVRGRHDVERTPRAEFNDGSRGPVAEQLPQKAISAKFAGLIDAAEYETMTLVEG